MSGADSDEGLTGCNSSGRSDRGLDSFSIVPSHARCLTYMMSSLSELSMRKGKNRLYG